MTIRVVQPSMPSYKEYIDEIKDLWESKWLTNSGIKHQKLESELANFLETPNLSLFSNGHLALETILDVLNLTGEVITTPFTFASTTHAIVRKGLTPVFCDINPEDYTIQTECLEKLINEKTSAILPVHVYGNICNVVEIERIAQKYNLKVIYDAAHAFGIKVNGKSVANFGDASMFSFHATKVFNTIEGGALTFKDTRLYQVLNSLKNFGITDSETVEYIGSNAKMNEFQAAMGICNLRHIENEINKRMNVVNWYLERLEGTDGIKLNKLREGIESNFAYMPVVFDGYRKSRDEVFHSLKEKNIYARKYFYPITNALACYKDSYDVEKTPIAKYISERVLTLPLHANLSKEEVNEICEIIFE